MKLFSRAKDYNEKLEEILENKVFSTSVKNLLLSMIYKIEISYEDFKEIKRVVRSQKEYLNELVTSIQVYCENIKLAEPDSEETQKLKDYKVLGLTNEKERSILTYPTETALLYSISDIVPKYFYISDNFILKKQLQQILVEGYNYNNLELITNFNGWSWDLSQKENINLVSNLIYQNLLFILGDKYLTEWRTHSSNKRNFLEEIRLYIKSITGNNNFYYKLLSVAYKTEKGKDKEKIKALLEEKTKELKKMQEREKYLEDSKKQKLKLTKFVEKLDLILNDQNLLIKEFLKANKKLDDDKKIGNIKIYASMLQKEREKCLKEISDIAFILKPMNFLKRKQELEAFEKISKNKNSIDEEVIELQKEFLLFLNKKMNKLEQRDEIVNIIYELRYIKNIYIQNGKLVSDIEILNTAIDKIMKKAITKACKIGAIRIISMDISLNYEIIKYALDTKIINLDEIKLNFEKKDDNLIIKVFDKEVFEKQGKKKIDNTKKILEVRYNRNIRLFN